MTNEELLKAAQELDEAYKGAEEFDNLLELVWRNTKKTESDEEETWGDQMEELRKAGLNHRGQP